MDAISGSENNAFVRAYGKPESAVSAQKSTLPLETAKVRLTDISESVSYTHLTLPTSDLV